MNMRIKVLFNLTLLFFLCQICGYSQIINGKLVSENQPIGYGAILNISTYERGTTTDLKGEFVLNLDGFDGEDVIEFSALGFEVKQVTVTELRGIENVIITLKSSDILLPEVRVDSKGLREKVIGLEEGQILRRDEHEVGWPFLSPGYFSGVIIDASNKKSILGSVHFYLTKQGVPNNRLMIKILVPSESMEPNRIYPLSFFRDYLDEIVLVEPKGDGWQSVDLVNRDIYLPATEFLVLFAPLDDGDKNYWTSGLDGKKSKYGSVIGYYENRKVKNMHWAYQAFKGLNYNNQRGQREFIPAIFLKVLQ